MKDALRAPAPWSLGSVISAAGFALSWFCCLPVVAGGFGVATAATGAAIVPLQPYLAGAALISLGVGFYHAYRQEACGPDLACAQPGGRRRQRLLLWTAATAAALLLTMPRWSSWLIYWSL